MPFTFLAILFNLSMCSVLSIFKKLSKNNSSFKALSNTIITFTFIIIVHTYFDYAIFKKFNLDIKSTFANCLL